MCAAVRPLTKRRRSGTIAEEPADFMGYNQSRVRRLNRAPLDARGDYVLYWMQAYRRFERNHALRYAVACASALRKPLVVYEGLRLDYPWASRRIHQFVLEGMQANASTAKTIGVNYWPFVETPAQPANGLLRQLAARASAVVTDDFPCFIVPEQSEALARRVSTAVYAVDGNCIAPLSLLGAAPSAAAHVRPRIHAAFADAWTHRTGPGFDAPDVALQPIEPPFEPWRVENVAAFVGGLPIDAVPAPAPLARGGGGQARDRIAAFLASRLRGYADARSTPSPPDEGHASGLSPYLHFGQISIEEVVERVLNHAGAWSVDDLRLRYKGRREGFYSDDPDVNAFLDQAVTWRDVGFLWQWWRRADTVSLDRALPRWALQTLSDHAGDRRAFLYTPEQFEAGETHDPLWNAAQRELVASGVIHSYLRMLWGKKVIEWSRSPADAYRTLEHLNNKYALDGRNPNSYSGILWCFGLFDRPWPERPALGKVRYMSSENTARKFSLDRYFAYTETLPRIVDVRAGRRTADPPDRQTTDDRCRRPGGRSGAAGENL
jgi:deoxyribodipyrimidine photo-lyase